MVDQSPRLSLPLIQPSQAQKHVTHNSALELLDVISQLHVLEKDAEVPPASPVNGDAYALGAAPQGAWAGQGGAIALRSNGGWLFIAPRNGWRLWDEASEELFVRKSDSWQPLSTLQNAAGVGINTSFDATNRLSVAADATLLTHDGAGGGHQLKVNKDQPANTASLLFQTSYSGRAEMGTMGNDAFAIKVSADGAQFVTALSFDSVTGVAGGMAIQQTPDDVTPGRLMRANWGYGPGNAIGAVSENGGVPTGAIIESGQTVNGEYVRFADGTQICTEALTLDFAGDNRIETTWEFPVAFSGVPQLVSGTLNANSLLANSSPRLDEICAPTHANMTSNQVKILQYRVAGATDFQSGDFAIFRAIAVGRWF